MTEELTQKSLDEMQTALVLTGQGDSKIAKVIAAARRALELEEALAAVLDNPKSTLAIWRDGVKWHVSINGEVCGEGSTPLEAIKNARRGM